MFNFDHTFGWFKKLDELHPSFFGLFMLVSDTINKDGRRWNYIHYRWPGKVNKNDMFFHFYDEKSKYHFFLRNKSLPGRGEDKYNLFWTIDHTLNHFDATQDENGWETLEDFANYFEDFLTNFRLKNS